MKNAHSNRLARESSPYLRQHADNPVNWYPWGEEAIEQAEKDDKPILLSIGYSACHWCHVMEKECFENEEIARVMNELFVAVKVDREERPDLDRLYMNAVQMLTGNGGWPLTVFLTPELVPFFGGTYFPPEDRGGMPGFPRVLRSVAAAYRSRSDEIGNSGGQIIAALRSFSIPSGERETPSRDFIPEAYSSLQRHYDWEYGGFGAAPKFPQTSALGFLLRIASEEQEDAALPGRAGEMVRKALDGVAAGGIRDHLGGGFHRYSVDRKWLVPHFEKMLYDNATLARTYLDAYVLTGNENYAGVARETLDYVLREMTGPEGGFCSSQDADTGGEEGAYYVWREEEVLSLLGEEEGRIIARYFGVDAVGNFEGNANVLHRSVSVRALSCLFEVGHEEAQRIVETRTRVLFDARQKRLPPPRDEKVIASWNGLMIGAMARGYQVLGDERFREAARKAGDFLLRELRTEEGLRHIWTKGQAKVPGFLEDYTLVVEGLLDLWEADFEVRWLKEAKDLADEMIELFWDEESQRFSFAGPKHEKLIADIPSLQDDPFPSGNSAAVHVLLRLAALTGEGAYREKAEGVLRSFFGMMRGSPGAFPHLLSALHRYLSPLVQVVIVGKDASAAQSHLKAVRSVLLPNATIVLKSAAAAEELEKLVPSVRGKSALKGKVTTYLCVGQSCLAPLTDARKLEKALRDTLRGKRSESALPRP
ncbi:MAG: thioredoxin domain-containing protein [bacterium]|nr:thioredoxin domain-containing protein [bacterium]